MIVQAVRFRDLLYMARRHISLQKTEEVGYESYALFSSIYKQSPSQNCFLGFLRNLSATKFHRAERNVKHVLQQFIKSNSSTVFNLKIVSGGAFLVTRLPTATAFSITEL